MATARLRSGLCVTALAVVAATALAGCGRSEGAQLTPDPAATPTKTTPVAAITLTVDRQRGGDTPVVSGGFAAPYNYAPTALFDGGRYRTWLCSQLPGVGPPGDDILYADAPNPNGPYPPGAPVYTGGGDGFDASHTCDPSVIRANGTYYLYYTGSPVENHDRSNSIGVATSQDGVHWTRYGHDHAIVGPSGDQLRDNKYGVGQPAAVYLDGWFYLMFTDTTGRAAGWNGAGQFVLRSKDPFFGTGVESVGEHGFAPVASTHSSRTRAVADAFSADLMWVDALRAFAIAHEVDGGTQLTFWNRDFTAQPYRPVTIPGPWAEGPGLIRRSDGHAPVSAEDPCHRVPLDVLRATHNPAAPTDIAWFGVDVSGFDACADPHTAAAMLDGVGVPASDRTIDVVLGGKRLRVERRSVAGALVGRVLDGPIPVVESLPLLARLPAGAPAIRADGHTGLVLDGKLWEVPSDAVATQNSSPLNDVPGAQWGGYPRGPDLRRLP